MAESRALRAPPPHPIGQGLTCCGDSLTECTVAGGGTCYPTLLATSLGVPVANAAVDGSTSTTWLVRSGVPLPAHWPCVDPPGFPSPYDLFVPLAQGSRWVTLMIGAGDALREVACPPGGLEDWTAPTTADQYEANMRELVARIWRDVPGLAGVLLVVPPHFQIGLGLLAPANAQLDLYAPRLQAIADDDRRARLLPGLDLRDLLDPSDYGTDILHPAQSGQDKIHAAFHAALVNLV